MYSKLPSFFPFLCLINYAILIETKDQIGKMEIEADKDLVKYKIKDQHNSKEEDQQKPLMIRMFMPEVKEKKTMRILDGQMPMAVVDVDIVAEKERKEEEEENGKKKNESEEVELTTEDLSQFEMEEKEIRRKQSAKQRTMPILRGWKKAASIKRKSVKLPPLHVPQAKAAPILRTTAEENNLVEEEGKEKQQQQGGRQFWVNALKTLLLEFRRMHPEIVANNRNNKKRKIIKEEMKEKEKGPKMGKWRK